MCSSIALFTLAISALTKCEEITAEVTARGLKNEQKIMFNSLKYVSQIKVITYTGGGSRLSKHDCPNDNCCKCQENGSSHREQIGNPVKLTQE